MIPTVFGIIVISFIIIRLAPGDPAAQKFGGVGQASAGLDAERGTEAAEKRFREKYHLDDPLYIQFGYFLQRFIKLDMIYFQQEKPIWPDLIDAVIVTLKINLIVFFLIYLFAVPIGIYRLVIAAMCTVATGAGGAGAPWMIPVGAIMFTASDIAVVRDRFVAPGFVNRLWGLPLYYAAQLIIAWSIMAVNA